jgi:hypothetical protein
MGCDYNIETSLAQLKTTMPRDVLHGQTVLGVLKELTIFAMVYNLVRLVMRQSAPLQHTAVERISFLNQSIRDWHSWAHRDAAPTRASGN